MVSKHAQTVLKKLEKLAKQYPDIEFFGETMLIWLGLYQPFIKNIYPLVKRDNPPPGRLFQPRDYPVMLMRDGVTYIDPCDETIVGVLANSNGWRCGNMFDSFLFRETLEAHGLMPFWSFFTTEQGFFTREDIKAAFKQWRDCSVYDVHYCQIDTDRYTHERERHKRIDAASRANKLHGRIAAHFKVPAL